MGREREKKRQIERGGSGGELMLSRTDKREEVWGRVGGSLSQITLSV